MSSFQKQYESAQSNLKFLMDFKATPEFGDLKIKEIKEVNYQINRYKEEMVNATYGIQYDEEESINFTL
jgi:hypothetical protein